MKSLPAHDESAEWQSRLLKDLSFIKKHKRYPFKRMTLMPLLLSGIVVAFLLRVLLLFILSKDHHIYRGIFVVFIAGVPAFISMIRYINILRFFVVQTPYYLNDNMRVLQEFLQEQHLLVFRHPEAPEVFQIISRNISVTDEEREVLIFIADNKRILINSHFTSARKWFKFIIAPTHHKQMVKMLSEWLTHRPSGSTELMA